MLTIEHFSKTYPGGKKAVDDLSLTVNAGEIMGFILIFLIHIIQWQTFV